jgi:hypothetical protein
VSGARTTTRRDLLRTAAVLVLLVVLTAVLAFVATDRAQRTADGVRDATVPAMVEVSAARGALVEADLAAVTSFRTGAVRLSGPGDAYREQIAIASQNLTQAATHDLGDSTTGHTLSLVNSLLTSYASAIEQAAASFRDNEHTALWAGDLWEASRLLHAGDGALALLDDLLDAQVSKLNAQVDSGTGDVLDALAWLVPSGLLLALLFGAQMWMGRRFRRMVNPGLAVATLLVVGLVIASALVFDTGGRLRATRDAAHEQTATWQRRMAARDAQGQQALFALIEGQCGIRAGECGSTVQRVVTAARPAGPVDTKADQLTDGSANIEALAGASTDNGVSLALIPITAVLAVLAAGAGLYPRFDEYRFRSR